MEVTERKLENASTELTIVVSPEDVNSQFDIEYKKIQKKAKLDGFRVGKAPLSVVKKKYQDNASAGVAEALIQTNYFKALDELKLHPVDHPKCDFESLKEGENFKFTALVDLYPEIELGDYKGVTVEEIRVKITDKDVTKEIDDLREKNAKISPRNEDAVVQKNDEVMIKVKQLNDENRDSEEGFSDMKVVAGKSENSFDFDSHVIGMKVGIPAEVTLEYPKKYQVESLAGEKLLYKLLVTEINERILPVADDEFAKDLGEFETFAELKNKTKEEIEKYTSERVRSEAKSDILKKIIEKSTYAIPQSLKDKEKVSIFNRLKQRFQVNIDDQAMFASLMGMTPEDFDKKLYDEAEQSLKTTLSLSEIAKAENLEVTDEKYNEQLQKVADQYQKGVDEIKDVFEKNGMKQNVQSELLFDLAMDFIYENAKIKKGSTLSMKEFMER